jgi:hypothetical protein
MTGNCAEPPEGLIFWAGLEIGGTHVIPPSGLALNLIPALPSVQATKTYCPLFETAGCFAFAVSLLRFIAGVKVGAAANTVRKEELDNRIRANDKPDK